MKIASHNSWTYAKPQRWWMHVFQPFTKCQKLNITDQYNKGVRFFDLRIKLFKNRIYSAHGAVVYDNPTGDMTYLEWLADRDDSKVFVRVLLESRHPSAEEISRFCDYCSWLESHCPHIVLFGGHGAHKPNWTMHYFDFSTKKTKVPSYCEYHASVSGGLIPYIFAKRNNRRVIVETENSGSYLMIDFVEL